MAKIVIAGVEFDNEQLDNLISANLFISNSLAGDELTIDTLDAELDVSTSEPTIFMPSDALGIETADNYILATRPYRVYPSIDLDALVYGQPVYYYHDGELYRKFYAKTIKRTGKYIFTLSCVSDIGLLDNSDHAGGMYDGETFAEVAADIIGGLVPFSIDPVLANERVYNWLPYTTRRNNLRDLLFVMGASVFRDEDGDMYISVLDTRGEKEIPQTRVYTGGNIKEEPRITRAIVYEHQYSKFDSDSERTLFEGSVSAEAITTPNGDVCDGAVVVFESPMHDLTVTNGEILESGVNYAVLAPSANCTLVGKEYTHTMRQVLRPSGNTPAARSVVSLADSTATVKDATLVSVANSENVADRVFAYYSAAKSVNLDIKVEDEKPGDAVHAIDPFDDEFSGYIKSMDITVSGILKSNTEMVVGYMPTAPGNLFHRSVVLTSPSTFTVPANTRKIMIVLVGAGQGGASGYCGYLGESGRSHGSNPIRGDGGDGGLPGEGGKGGNIMIATFAVTPNEQFAFVPGIGGAGGEGIGISNHLESQNQEGALGTATTFTSVRTGMVYSSASGAPLDTGYTDIFTGELYGALGSVGRYAGGKGNGVDVGDTVVSVHGTFNPGANGDSYQGDGIGAGGGGGGGASSVANGSNGGYGYTDGLTVNGGVGGKGADGGNGIAAFGYGFGGNGGDGGGGGGGGGSASSDWVGSGGIGGIGGTGSDGGNGCAIIYLP